MSNCTKIVMRGIVASTLILMIGSALVWALPFPSGPGDDNRPSLAVFRIWVMPQFRPLVASLGLPPCGSQITEMGCYDGATPFRLTSSVLFDGATIIGRSNPHTHGSPADGGTTVGSANPVTVGDGHFTVVPLGFQGPTGRTEIHTAVASMVMTSPIALGPMIRAGHALGLPLCPGEVESKAGTDLPGQSFFDVFVEVTIPQLGTPPTDAIVTNSTALLIVNDSLDSLPPTVVYIHDNSTAVPVSFANSNPGYWNAGDLLGYLVLAGHGISYNANKQAGLSEFLQIMNDHLAADGEMPLPGQVPVLTEWGMIIVCFLLLGSAVWVTVRLRRRVVARR
ncbi:MAG TPA: hypothetical protein VN285_09510 [Candidatus Deferrimicrobium sp.]|nr:hypothetical protein [Candidatus Deferrimicrobium sp.]